MSEHCGYVIKVTELEKHPNADKLQLLKIFGTETAVSLDVKVGDIGIYFGEGLRLSDEMCQANDLVRRKDDAGNPAGGFLEPGKQNIKTIRLRERYSDGIYLPLASLTFTGAKLEDFKVGDTIDIVNGVQICTKYIPRTNPRPQNGGNGNGNHTRKKKAPIAPLFAEHADTSQLAYNLAAFQPGDTVEITLKMHGTSTRTGHLPVFKKYKRSLLDIILRRPGTPVYEYGYISGTRRTVLENYEGGYYGSNAFREPHSKIFEGKLHKGECVFAEIVGYTDTGVPIMPTAANKTVGEEFVKQYGEKTEFSYGCYPTGKRKFYGRDEEGTFCIEEPAPQSDLYVYRMTYTDPDGRVIEYSPEYMRLRCEQMGVKSVPVLWRGIIPKNDTELGIVHDHDEYPINAGEWIQKKAEEFYDGPDPIGKNHVREGVVVRITSRPNQFCAYKTKNRSFKILSGIAVDNAQNSDMDADRLAEV